MSAAQYNHGDTVGIYTVIERSTENNLKLICQCNICHSIVDVYVSNIRRQRMCRNCRTKYNTKPKTDLVGQKFGRLTVIEWVQRDGHTIWRCICDCGSEVLVGTNHLRSGHTQSCGCYMREQTSKSNSRDLSGKRFGRLSVISKVEGHRVTSGQTLTKYLCHCDCGNDVEIIASNLVSGNSMSCGCIGNSKGEFTTHEFLLSNGIAFTKQHSFRDLRSKKNGVLKFDFALWSNNRLVCLVEYNGEQHYYPPSSHKEFGKLQRDETDALKRSYCAKHDIKLFELRFDEDLSRQLNEVLEYYRKNL